MVVAITAIVAASAAWSMGRVNQNAGLREGARDVANLITQAKVQSTTAGVLPIPPPAPAPAPPPSAPLSLSSPMLVTVSMASVSIATGPTRIRYTELVVQNSTQLVMRAVGMDGSRRTLGVTDVAAAGGQFVEPNGTFIRFKRNGTKTNNSANRLTIQSPGKTMILEVTATGQVDIN